MPKYARKVFGHWTMVRGGLSKKYGDNDVEWSILGDSPRNAATTKKFDSKNAFE